VPVKRKPAREAGQERSYQLLADIKNRYDSTKESDKIKNPRLLEGFVNQFSEKNDQAFLAAFLVVFLAAFFVVFLAAFLVVFLAAFFFAMSRSS
jgi:hypothetical protein